MAMDSKWIYMVAQTCRNNCRWSTISLLYWTDFEMWTQLLRIGTASNNGFSILRSSDSLHTEYTTHAAKWMRRTNTSIWSQSIETAYTNYRCLISIGLLPVTTAYWSRFRVYATSERRKRWCNHYYLTKYTRTSSPPAFIMRGQTVWHIAVHAHGPWTRHSQAQVVFIISGSPHCSSGGPMNCSEAAYRPRPICDLSSTKENVRL